MMRHDARGERLGLHEDAWELLPWYVNGTLEHRERDAVAMHVETCERCQGELARCRSLATALRAQGDVMWVASADRFARLMGRIDVASASAAPVRGWRERLSAWVGSISPWLSVTPRPARWALAAQGMLVVMLAGGLVWQASVSPGPRYRTLTGTGTGAARGAQIRVVFADDITERDLRALLTGIEGAIVGGPSPMGVYTVEVPSPATHAGRADAALAALRVHPKVRLAEPATPSK